MDSFYTREELVELGFASVGENVLISRKASFYGTKNMSIGSNVRIDDFCFLSGKITLGNYIHIAVACVLYGSAEGITMSDFTTLAPRISIHADSDDYSGESLTNPTTPEKYKSIARKPVFIGKHVIVGTGCVILPGVTLGEGCSVGSMSFVKKSLEPWTINAGNPCKAIKARSKKLLEHEINFLNSQ